MCELGWIEHPVREIRYRPVGRSVGSRVEAEEASEYALVEEKTPGLSCSLHFDL